MSALAMVLAAGIVIGDGPEKVSAEVESELRLEGEWEGGLWGSREVGIKVKVRGGRIYWWKNEDGLRFKVLIEGPGRVRALWDATTHLGIYKWQGGHLIMCFGDADTGRPTNFRGSDTEDLIKLRRVKPTK